MSLTTENIKLALKKYAGVDVELCDYFTGVRGTEEQGKFINVILKDRNSESEDFRVLKSYENNPACIYKKIEPNGVRRVAVFIKEGVRLRLEDNE